MNFKIENLNIKSFGAIFGFSFDIKVNENVIGSCDISIENIHSQLDVRSNGSNFLYTPNWAFHAANRFFNGSRETGFPFVTNEQEIALRNVPVSNDHHIGSHEMEPTYSARTETYQRQNLVHTKDSYIPPVKERQSSSTLTHTNTNQEIFSSRPESIIVEIVTPNNDEQTQNTNMTDSRILCEKCPKTFSSKRNLERHVKVVHDKIKECRCEECGKLFAVNGDLKRHIESVHKVLKRFECTECGQSFTRKHHLEKHQMTHTVFDVRINHLPKKVRVSGL